MIKAEVAKDKTGLGRVQGGNIPGPAATLLLCPAPGALQLTVGLGVVSKQLGLALIRKFAIPQALGNFSVSLLKVANMNVTWF